MHVNVLIGLLGGLIASASLTLAGATLPCLPPRAHRRWPRRTLLLVAATVCAVLAASYPAGAHIPVMLTPCDNADALAASPMVLSGTTSFAFYGRTGHTGETRAVRIQLVAGQQFHAELLIPDLAPETGLDATGQPRLAIDDPSGQARLLDNTQRSYFFEPLTQTSYLVLAETTSVAATGTYAVIVIGGAPTRFVAVTGQDEQFAAAVVNASRASTGDVLRWYTTPPAPDGPGDPANPDAGPTTGNGCRQ
ncbi:hypothetical protein [Rhodococcus sp. NPDC059234]|uniref:hypothetical protein n=1 Tax=Rhodococcus sp. NPDC059234 TaxID=3346781 RepID=UPI00366EC255